MSEVVCPYCHQNTEYVSSEVVYGGRDFGMIYLCKMCEAWVGVHKGSREPLGRLANKELREWKIKAHDAFDPLWQAKLTKRRKERGHYKKAWARNSGYRWLAEQLGITREECHIGMFDIETCKKVVEICKPHLDKHKEVA